MSLTPEKIKAIIESALFTAGRPLSIDRLSTLFIEDDPPANSDIRQALNELMTDYQERSIELKEVASGWRFQSKDEYAQWLQRLWEEKPSRYSRASLETLALIAYRQPVTRGEIEDVRGVSVSSSIVKSLIEREWIRIIGHRDVPGRPALYATTRGFLDYFNLKSLDALPSLAEIRDLDSLNPELDLKDKHVGNDDESLLNKKRDEALPPKDEQVADSGETSPTEEEASPTTEEASLTVEETSPTAEQTSADNLLSDSDNSIEEPNYHA